MTVESTVVVVVVVPLFASKTKDVVTCGAFFGDNGRKVPHSAAGHKGNTRLECRLRRAMEASLGLAWVHRQLNCSGWCGGLCWSRRQAVNASMLQTLQRLFSIVALLCFGTCTVQGMKAFSRMVRPVAVEPIAVCLARPIGR